MSILAFASHVIKAQWFTTIPMQTATFENQTVVITGANAGLGLAAAKYMVSHKAAKVIIACRNVTKGEAAKKQLEDGTGRVGVVDLWELDLASYPSIKKFAAKAEAELDRLDVVICSAGISTLEFKHINDLESTIAVNVVSTLLLSILLLPQLKRTAAQHTETTPHLAIVSSDTHMVASLDKQKKNKDEPILAQLSDKKRAQMASRYALSKLLDVLMTFQLAAHVGQDYPVIINTINPGLCRSELLREGPGFVSAIVYAILHARSPEQGIQNYIYAVSAGRDMHGKYISECEEGPLGPGAQGERADTVGARLWKELTEMLENIEPGIMSRL